MKERDQDQVLRLVQEVRTGWEQTLSRARAGDHEGTVAALNQVEAALQRLLDPRGPLQADSPETRELVAQLVAESQRVSQEIEAALSQVAGQLGELREQRLKLRMTRHAHERAGMRPQWLDRKG